MEFPAHVIKSVCTSPKPPKRAPKRRKYNYRASTEIKITQIERLANSPFFFVVKNNIRLEFYIKCKKFYVLIK